MTDHRTNERIHGMQRARRYCLCLLLAAGLAPGAWSTEPAAGAVVFSIDAKDRPLGDVLDQIREDTGYRVKLTDEKWRQFPVSGQVSEESVFAGLRRLIQGRNHYLAVTGERVYTLYISDARKSLAQTQATPAASGISEELLRMNAVVSTPPDHPDSGEEVMLPPAALWDQPRIEAAEPGPISLEDVRTDLERAAQSLREFEFSGQ